MGELISVFLNAAMIALLVIGIGYAVRLSKQLAELRASRAEMGRFVAEFSSTVQRAEAGVRGLKQAAREGGDDLEQLIEKAQSLRDELHFLVESADQIANRLSNAASVAARAMLPETPSVAPSKPAATVKPSVAPPVALKPSAPVADKKAVAMGGSNSMAERELLKALEKLG